MLRVGTRALLKRGEAMIFTLGFRVTEAASGLRYVGAGGIVLWLFVLFSRAESLCRTAVAEVSGADEVPELEGLQ